MRLSSVRDPPRVTQSCRGWVHTPSNPRAAGPCPLPSVPRGEDRLGLPGDSLHRPGPGETCAEANQGKALLRNG